MSSDDTDQKVWKRIGIAICVLVLFMVAALYLIVAVTLRAFDPVL